MFANRDLIAELDIWLTDRLDAFGRWSEKSWVHTSVAGCIVVLTIILAMALPALILPDPMP